MAIQSIAAWMRSALPVTPKITEVVKWFREVSPLIENKRGIEIEGFHEFFKTRMPIIHTLPQSLDRVNFSKNAVYDGCSLIDEGEHGAYQLTGRRYLGEVISLSPIDNQQYDFVLCADNLQKTANPIKALTEIYRILKEGGTLVWMQSNQDQDREVTTIEHLIYDHLGNMSEQDSTHAQEVLGYYRGDNKLAFKQAVDDNLHQRIMHHHVFDLELMEDALGYVNFEVLIKEENDDELIVVAIKN